MTPTPVDDPARRRILILASEKFLREGFAHITIEQLVLELGMSKKTFYKFFPNKEALVEGIIEPMRSEIMAAVKSVTRGQGDFIEKIYELMTILGVQTSRFSKAFQRDLQRFTPAVWTRIEGLRRETIGSTVASLVEEGIRQGYIRKGINKRLFLKAYLSAIDGVVRPSVLADEPYSMNEAIDGIMSMFFQGILTAEASKKLDQYQLSHSS